MEKTIVVKRKEFTILEKLGERSYKVSRNGKFFFMKKIEDDEEFFLYVKAIKRFKITAINIPKPYLFDKKSKTVFLQYIEGETVLEMICRSDLPEKVFEFVFRFDYCGRNENMLLDYLPENFKFDGNKLYYLPFTYKNYDKEINFPNKGIRYWFYTKELVEHLKEKGLAVNESRIGNQYETNKKMALMTVKYY